MTFENIFAADSVKPSEEVQKQVDSLETVLVEAVNAQVSAPFTPGELLSHAKAHVPRQLAQVTDYLHSAGFVQSQEPSVAVLYYALRISPWTGRGKRVHLINEAGRVIVDYFPGYSAATPLKQFLMQEFPLPLSTMSGKGRNLHPRETRVNQLFSDLRTQISKYQSRMRQDLGAPRQGQMTVGDFLALPGEVTSPFQDTVYPLLQRHGLVR